jgi:hypothetical protein
MLGCGSWLIGTAAYAQSASFTQIYGIPTINLFGGAGHGFAFAMDNNG